MSIKDWSGLLAWWLVLLMALYTVAYAIGSGLGAGLKGGLVHVDAGFTLSHSNFVAPENGGPALVVRPSATEAGR